MVVARWGGGKEVGTGLQSVLESEGLPTFLCGHVTCDPLERSDMNTNVQRGSISGTHTSTQKNEGLSKN